MQRQDNDYLIGSLLAIPAEALEHEVYARYAQAGYSDVRLVHSPIFRHLPPQGCRVTELARRGRMTKQAAGYLVDTLVEHGYLERVPDPTDGRAQIIKRTAKGWEINRLARQYVEEVQAEWTREYGEENMQQLLTLLRDLVHGVLKTPYQGSISQLSIENDPYEAAQLSKQQDSLSHGDSK
jgi:DNA-binding MarR family transcriptional regulator